MTLAAQYDLAVVGAGPAGLATALFLHASSPSLAARTVVIEKARHPREKICAGAIGRRADRLLETIDVRVEVPSSPLRGIAVTAGGETLVVRADEEVGRVVRRSAFDAALASAVRERGIEIREDAKVVSVTPNESGMHVAFASGDEIHARAVVGADGVGSVVRKSLGIGNGPYVAQVAEIDTERVSTDLDADIAAFDLSAKSLSGYAWDFPTPLDGETRACRGAYRLRRDERTDGAEPDVSELTLARAPSAKRIGALRRFAERGLSLHEPIARPHVLLAGEAAGIDPVLGEGIAQAIFYGATAAQYLAPRLFADDLSFGDWPNALRRSRVGLDLRLRELCLPLVYGRGRLVLERWVTRSEPLARAGLAYFGGARVSRLALGRALLHLARAFVLVAICILALACGPTESPPSTPAQSAPPLVSASAPAPASASASASAPAPASAFASASASAPALIPNTDVPDTPENRQVVSFCEHYRIALEKADVTTLLSLASPQYHDDGGTADPTDDIDRKTLEDFLKKRLKTTTALRYEIRYRSIDRRAGHIRVSISYAASFRLSGSSSVTHRVDDSVIDLVETSKGFAIVSGM